MPNLGPATTVTSNTVAALTPVNAPASSFPQAGSGLRILAAFRGVSLAGTGDAAQVAIVNATSWAAATVVVANGLVSGVSATVAAASVGIFTGAASTGTTVRTQGVLTGQTSTTVATVAAAASAAVASTAQSLYLNVGTALANATVDIFVLGYDLS
jgi:hypothetical protein